MKRILISEEERSRILGMHQEKGYKPLMEQAAPAPAPAQGQTGSVPAQNATTSKEIPSFKNDSEKLTKFTNINKDYITRCGFMNNVNLLTVGTNMSSNNPLVYKQLFRNSEKPGGSTRDINYEPLVNDIKKLLGSIAYDGKNFKDFTLYDKMAGQAADKTNSPVINALYFDKGNAPQNKQYFIDSLKKLAATKMQEMGYKLPSGVQGCSAA